MTETPLQCVCLWLPSPHGFPPLRGFVPPMAAVPPWLPTPHIFHPPEAPVSPGCPILLRKVWRSTNKGITARKEKLWARWGRAQLVRGHWPLILSLEIGRGWAGVHSPQSPGGVDVTHLGRRIDVDILSIWILCFPLEFCSQPLADRYESMCHDPSDQQEKMLLLMIMMMMMVMVMVVMILVMMVMTVLMMMVMVTMTTTSSKLSAGSCLCQAWRWALYIRSFLSLPAPLAGAGRTIVLHILEPVFISSEHAVPPHSPGYLWLCNSHRKT